MNKSCRMRPFVAGLAIVALAGCSWAEGIRERLRPITATPTTPVTVTQGQVRDSITRLPIGAARLESGPVLALSDVEGAFSVPSLAETQITVTAPGYEPALIRPRPGFPLVVDLVPDASTTFTILYNYEKQHEFGREYELLHPDVQTLFSRDEFIRYMEEHRPYDILDFTVGPAEMLASGAVLGKMYNDVAQVRVLATVRVGPQVVQRGWLGYAARADGLWRWFRGPLLWPTPTPSPSASP